MNESLSTYVRTLHVRPQRYRRRNIPIFYRDRHFIIYAVHNLTLFSYSYSFSLFFFLLHLCQYNISFFFSYSFLQWLSGPSYLQVPNLVRTLHEIEDVFQSLESKSFDFISSDTSCYISSQKLIICHTTCYCIQLLLQFS